MRCFCTKSKVYHCKVVLLDDQKLLQKISNTSTGQDVLDSVFRHLNVIETSYFGLRYIDCTNQTHWLDVSKKVTKQLKGKDSLTLYFGVKFYASDPCKLVEEITRYQFFLQIKQDILQARLPVPVDLLAELGAYAVQSELGDYDQQRHGPGYVSEFRFISNQSVELENRISELHKDLRGQLPAVAELNYLDKIKWLEMYGVDLHPVIGEDNVEYFLGLTPSGVIVLRNKSKVANYFWSRIKKIYFKGKYFMLRVYDKNNEENTYGFETPSRAACKHLCKCCMEHHSFFQLVHVSTINTPDVVNTRFSNTRTDKLCGRSSQLGMRNPPNFVRTKSRRYQRRIVEGASEDTDSKIEEKVSTTDNTLFEETKNIYVTQTSNSYCGSRSDSPRSTRSAPWSVWSTSGPPRNPHSSHSPRSVRSAGPQLRLTDTRRSSSLESLSSTDSRLLRRHKHRSKRSSDNESEPSRCSSHNHGNHRRHRHRSRRSSGNEQHHRNHHSNRSRYQLIDSELQWKEIQRKQAEGSTGIQEATVIRPGSGYVNSGIETESEHSTCHHHRRRHRMNRSRSRSPSDGGKTYLPVELKKHLEFQLVDTAGMSTDQLREIPYTVVKTNAPRAVRVRLSSSRKPKAHCIRRTKNEDSPPPPYSESPVLADLNNKATMCTSSTASATISNSIRHCTRLSTHSMENTTNINLIDPCSSSNITPSIASGQSTYLPQSNVNCEEVQQDTAWSSENAKFSNLGFVMGLPPQSHGRRSFGNVSLSDLSLNASKSNSQKGCHSPGIRGTIGLPSSSRSDQLHQVPSPINSVCTFQDNNRLSPAPAPAPSLVDFNYLGLNQNTLEHRSVNGNCRGLVDVRSGPKAGLRTASTPMDLPLVRSGSTESEKFKKPNSVAESGVLRSHALTSSGKMVWPIDRHFGGLPMSNEKQMNVNQVWRNNDTDWSSNECIQWNGTWKPNWQQELQQQQQPQPHQQLVNFRTADRKISNASLSPQMQKINEIIPGEDEAETRIEYMNRVNNNQFTNNTNSPTLSNNYNNSSCDGIRTNNSNDNSSQR